MRRLVIAALVIVPSLAAAQTSPLHTGGWIISGSAALSHVETDNGGPSSTGVSLAPSGLYFVSPRLAVGGSVLLGYQSAGSLWTYGIGPEVRYFIADPGDKLLPFVRGSIVPEWERSSLKTSGGTFTNTSRVTAVLGSAGLTQIVASHVGITGEVYFERDMFDTGSDGAQADRNLSSYGLRFGLTVFVH